MACNDKVKMAVTISAILLLCAYAVFSVYNAHGGAMDQAQAICKWTGLGVSAVSAGVVAWDREELTNKRNLQRMGMWLLVLIPAIAAMFTGGIPQIVLGASAAAMLMLNIGLGSFCCPQLAFWSSSDGQTAHEWIEICDEWTDLPTDNPRLRDGARYSYEDISPMGSPILGAKPAGAPDSYEAYRSPTGTPVSGRASPDMTLSDGNPTPPKESFVYESFGGDETDFSRLDNIRRRLVERLRQHEAGCNKRSHQAA